MFSLLFYTYVVQLIAFLLTELGYLAFRNRGNSNWKEYRELQWIFAQNVCLKLSQD